MTTVYVLTHDIMPDTTNHFLVPGTNTPDMTTPVFLMGTWTTSTKTAKKLREMGALVDAMPLPDILPSTIHAHGLTERITF